MELLLKIHSFTRWVVLALMLVALLRFGLGWLRAQSFSKIYTGLMRGQGYLLLLQGVLGLVLLVGLFNVRQFEHALPMLLAIGMPHMAAARGRKAADDRGRFRIYFLFALLAALLVVAGIFALAGGWSRNAWLN